MKDKVELSKYDRMKGKLHLEKIKSISMNGNPFFGVLKMEYDKGGVFDFVIKSNTVELQLEWVNYPPKPEINEFSVIKIEAEKV